MVKNTGGCKAKGFARKHQSSHISNKLRMSECDEEKYAIVRKLFGPSCDVLCDDSKVRLAMIPGKFSGRNKRNNNLAPGTVILIGIREWATVIEGKSEKCDVLEVYSAQELDQLKQRPNFPTRFLDDTIRDTFGSSKAAAVDDKFVFSSIEEISHIESETKESEILMETDEMISIDDI
jgi:translation initiation factor IF-1